MSVPHYKVCAMFIKALLCGAVVVFAGDNFFVEETAVNTDPNPNPQNNT